MQVSAISIKPTRMYSRADGWYATCGSGPVGGAAVSGSVRWSVELIGRSPSGQSPSGRSPAGKSPWLHGSVRRGGRDQVHDREDHDPHDVDEVPVQPDHL